MSKYLIIRGSTFGELVCHSEFVGYNAETGEDEYEDVYETKSKPHEEVITEFDIYDAAREEFQKIIDNFIETHPWPFNDPHYEFRDGSCEVEFTDGEDSYWFTLRTEE